MPREIITLQIGQCGNQIGRQFWQLVLEEHDASTLNNNDAKHNMSTFFRSSNFKAHGASEEEQFTDKTRKARAILVDTEQGPVNSTLRGPLRHLFDHRQLLTDVSGAGNNWAHGYCAYGPQYRESLLAILHKEVEACDSLQSFFLLHSMGGGTGSGLGTYILGLLEDEYPHVYRFTTAIFPSEDDDVITSPYNSILALNQLVDHADCVIPIQNEALVRMSSRVANTRRVTGFAPDNLKANSVKDAFESMNSLVARLLTDLTASVRFKGSLNVDLNEISTNLVPYPKLHFLLSSISTTHRTPDIDSHNPSQKSIRHMFTQVFEKDHQYMCAAPRSSVFLACGFFARGNALTITDVNDNIQRLQRSMRMIQWNQEGFKAGLCSVPPTHQIASVLCLSNNCCLGQVFQAMLGQAQRCYKRRAHFHHYLEYMEEEQMDQALEQTENLIQTYCALETTNSIGTLAQTRQNWKRLVPL